MNARSLIDGDAPLPADWATTLVVAVGNPSRGDDAAGPLLTDRLASWLNDPTHGDRSTGAHTVTVLCDQQLMVEHAYDLHGDAGAGLPYHICNWVDHAVTFVRGHRLPTLYGRKLAEWIDVLKNLGFQVETMPMSEGKPFANIMLICRVPG